MNTHEPIKVAHLTSFHPPHDTRVGNRELRTLAAAGYDVVLIASCDPADAARCDFRVHCVPVSKTRWQRIWSTLRQIYRVAMDERAALYHFHDPELIPVGLALKLRGKRVVYDVHEDVPRQVMTFGFIPRLLRRPLSWAVSLAEWAAGRCLDRIVTVTPTIAARFPARKTVIVHNYPPADELAAAAQQPYAARPQRVAYVGGISDNYGVPAMVRAMGLLDDLPEARLALAGKAFVPPQLEDECRAMPGWARVDFLGWRNREQLADLFAASRLGLAVLRPTQNYLDSWPTKLFEYMAAGLPIVASDFPVWRDLLGGYECVLWVDPLDSEAIAEAVRRLLTHPDEAEAMGHRGRQAIEQELNWESQAARLLDLYRELTGR
ncbi:MAG: glycosyltransferase family 4 protein [Planctomycetes bacterium]|nr:glycosyltransferase family 4 protein [Planctomycetota bacterium]